LFNLFFFSERSWFVGVEKGGCCEKILDSGDTLIGVDRKKGREIPSIGEVGVCGESITCDFPDSDSVSKNSFVGMFGCFPVVNGGCGKLVVMNVAILMFRCILGLSDSGQVWGEDNALWIAEDSGVCHFLVACGSSVGGVSRLGPYDLVGRKMSGLSSSRSAIVVKLWGLAIFVYLLLFFCVVVL